MKRLFPNGKNINSIMQIPVQSSLEYWKCRKCLMIRYQENAIRVKTKKAWLVDLNKPKVIRIFNYIYE